VRSASDSFALRAYFASRRFLQRLFSFSNACLAGFWLGVFRRETLSVIDQRYYDRERMYQNDDYNKGGLWEWERRVIGQYFSGCKSLLLIGAGGGREVIALSRLAYRVDAFECNATLATCANQLLAQEGIPVQVRLVARDACPETGQTYDAAIVGWATYMLIPGRAHRIRLLTELKMRLPQQAPILLSFFSYKKTRRYYRVTAGVGNCFRWLLRRERLDVGDDLSPNYVHYFTRRQIERELTEAGYELALYAAEPYGHAVGIAR
jgi:hypothetical protein